MESFPLGLCRYYRTKWKWELSNSAGRHYVGAGAMRQIDINSSLTDALSPTAYEVLGIGKDSAYSTLIVRGEGNREAAGRLRGIDAQDLLTPSVVSQSDGDAMLAGLWLWHDWL